MTRHIRKKSLQMRVASLLGASLLAIAAIGVSTAGHTGAAFAQDPEARQFSPDAGEKVNEALTLANSGQTSAAVSILQSTIGMPDLSAFERSTIYQMLGQYSYELGRTGEALQAWENAVSAGGLLPKETDNIRLIIPQLMIENGQYREGATRLENFLNSGGQQNPQHVELLVNAWVQAEDFSRALPWAERWFNNANPKERRHFDLLNYLFNTLGMQGRQADIVKEMINRWPEDKSLWDAWVYMLDSGGREQEAFEVTKMLYLGGGLSEEDDLVKVVNYYSYYDMPYQAAQILEREIQANRIARTPSRLTQLSTLFRSAREYKRAIPILEDAARQSGDKDTFAALGEALYNEGECDKSEAAFNEAISRGFDAGRSWMQIGSCRYDATNELERLNCEMTPEQMAAAPITKARETAINAFKNVPLGTSSRRDANTWVKFIEDERKNVDNRCEFEKNVERDLCYQKIKQAYDAVIFTDGFKLQDQSCLRFKEGYDKKFVVRTTE